MTRQQISRGYQVVIFLAFLLSLLLAWPDPERQHDRISGLIYDTLLPTPKSQIDNRVVIIDIDEDSLQKIGRWPWSRDVLAELIQKLQQQNPAIVGLDILLPEASTVAADSALKAELAVENVVTAITFASPSLQQNQLWPQSQRIVDLTPALITEGKTQRAHITPTYDGDGAIRRLHPIICKEECYKTLSAAMLERLTGMKTQLQDSQHIWKNDQLCIGPYCQYLDQHSYIWIAYHKSQQLNYIPAWRVLSGESIPELAGTMALLGTSAVGLGDNVVTPLAPETPGVNIHATLISSWLDNLAWQPLPNQSLWQSLLLLLLTFLAWLWRSKRVTIKFPFIAVAAITLTLPHTLIYLGIWFDPAPTTLLIILVMLALTISNLLESISTRQQLYKAFSSYVPPEVLKRMAQDSSGLTHLSPQRAQVTVIFADIQGFTRLCENLAPEKVVEMTNYLFTELTEEVHRHNGTLDKFMGDCLMAFWGAPIKTDNHARLAVACAESLQTRVAELEPWLASHDLPPIKLSIGIESGEVTVGNLGSQQRRAYTVMGHSVNLAAHLQTMTKTLGESILLGPQTASYLPKETIRELQTVQPKGLTEPQMVSTPIQTRDR